MKEKALRDLHRAEKSIAVTMLGPQNSRERTRDVLIWNTMQQMKSATPWSIKGFLTQIAMPCWNEAFDIIGQSNILSTYFEFRFHEQLYN